MTNNPEKPTAATAAVQADSRGQNSLSSADLLNRAYKALGDEGRTPGGVVTVLQSRHWDAGQAPAGPGTPALNYGTGTTTLTYNRNGNLILQLSPRPVYPLQWTFDIEEHIVEGRYGWRKGADAYGAKKRAPISGARIATRLKTAKLIAPDWLLADVFADEVTIEWTDDGLPLLVTTWNGARTTLRLDQTTNLPEVVTVTEDLPLSGDVLYEVRYADWRDVGGAQYPYRLQHYYGDVLVEEDLRESVETGVSFQPTVPDKARDSHDADAHHLGNVRSRFFIDFLAKNFPMDEQATEVDLKPVTLADGVVALYGELYNQLAVDLGDRILVVEAPFSPEWSDAALKVLGDLWPDKPVGTLVLSHFHFDHVGGLRPFVARGAEVLIPQRFVSAVEAAANGTKTLVPDILTRQPTTPQVTGLEGVRRIEGSNGRVVEVHVVETRHSMEMAVVWLPAERVMFTTDLYSPGLPPTRGLNGWIGRKVISRRWPLTMLNLGGWAEDLLSWLNETGFEPEAIVGGHGEATGRIKDVRIVAGYARG